jgi:hypothetical protein
MTTEEKDRDGEDRKSAKESGKKSGGDENEADDSAAGLEPGRPKVGESKDNLKKRADYFQKRHGGG